MDSLWEEVLFSIQVGLIILEGTAAKQAKPTGMQPYGNPVPQHLTGSYNVIWTLNKVHLDADILVYGRTAYSDTHNPILHIYIAQYRWCAPAKM